ncbi:MAG TPA: GGDEF domain-containing protein [Phycisphaerae bacterium]|nr:GGDEF domain-containing protein [Phycisphaerae bacterium]
MVVLVGAGLLQHFQLGVDEQEAEKVRAVAMAETYATQAAAVMRSGRGAELEAFVDKTPLHPSACLLAVLDRHDHALAARGNKALIRRFVELGFKGPQSLEPGAWSLAGDPEHKVPPLTLVGVPIVQPDGAGQLGFLVYAARLSGQDGLATGRIARFFLGLVIVSLIGLAAGFSWMRSRVLQPLAELVSQVKARESSGEEEMPATLTDRGDEMGVIARAIVRERQELKGWQSRALQIERVADTRLAAERQRISRELRQAEKKITTDPLTNLGNRQLLMDRFVEIFDTQKRAGHDLSVILIDVDHFKEVNDTLGHKAGDELLVFVGELLRQCLREHDMAVRYGGDEFLLVLPSVTLSNAAAVAERTIRLFAQQAGVLAVQPKPSMSAGVASLVAHMPASAEELLEMADQALYEAKKAGKSLVRVAGGVAVATEPS